MNLDKTTDEIIEAAKNILEDKECGRVFRVKGFLKDEAGEWLELNATHQEMRICPIPEGQEVVIVIGEELNEERIQQERQYALGNMMRRAAMQRCLQKI